MSHYSMEINPNNYIIVNYRLPVTREIPSQKINSTTWSVIKLMTQGHNPESVLFLRLK